MIDFKTSYRKYKIAEVLGEEFEDEEFLKLIGHIKKTITNPDFKEFVDDKHPNKIWYGLSKTDIYMRYDENGVFWLDYDKIWSIFESSFGYDYQTIKLITKNIIKQQYKSKHSKVSTSQYFKKALISSKYTLREATVTI